MTVVNHTNKGIPKIPVACIALILLSCGCRSFEKAMTKNLYKRKPSSTGAKFYVFEKVHFNQMKLKETNFVGQLTVRKVDVEYQQDLQDQADCVAEQIASLLQSVENRLALTIPSRVKVYLIRRDYIPQNLEGELEADPNQYQFVLPLFIPYNNQSCETILSENPLYPSIFIHEVVESSLVWPKYDHPVLVDLSTYGGWLKIRNYTRWFRDGLAGYAQYVAHEITSSNDKFVRSKYHLLHRHLIPQCPLSSLYRVKTNLFSWHQFSDERLDHDYYNASLGLFLLIKDQFGEDAIRKVINRLNTSDYLDGMALTEIINETCNTDIKRLVKNFYWPKIGLRTIYLRPAFAKNQNLAVMEGLFIKSIEEGGLAYQVGLQEKDVIISVDGQPVVSNLSFEIALLGSIKQKKAHITVDRFGVREELVLEFEGRG